MSTPQPRPVPLAHVLYTWEGVFGSATAPIETWQFSLKSRPLSGVAESTRTAQALALSTCYSENIRGIMPQDVILTRCTSVAVNGDGHYDTDEDGSYDRGEWSGSITGTVAGQPILPLQTALTVSLSTARVGPTGKGRFFLPFPGEPLDAGHRIADASAQVYANRLAEFVRDVNLVGGEVSVFSSKRVASVVTGVRVGRVPDTMRSRRGDMVESYALAAV